MGPSHKLSNMSMVLVTPKLTIGVGNEDGLVDRSLTLQSVLNKDQKRNAEFRSMTACPWPAYLTLLG